MAKTAEDAQGKPERREAGKSGPGEKSAGGRNGRSRPEKLRKAESRGRQGKPPAAAKNKARPKPGARYTAGAAQSRADTIQGKGRRALKKGEYTMKILILNPNSDTGTEQVLADTARAFLEGRTQFETVSMKTAPRLVVTYEDQAAGAAEMASIVKARRDEFDAFIVACHADPSLELVREAAAPKPVFGIAEASMRMAAQLAGGYAVLTPSEKIIPKKFALARKYHCEEQLKTVTVSRGDDTESLIEAGRRALATPGVGALVLGCANYSGQAGKLQAALGVPVLDGLIWALILAEGAAREVQFNARA